MDNAFEKARAAYGTGAYDDATLEFIFPELKESEDERIRKEMLNYLKRKSQNTLIPFSLANAQRWIAWLEKQEEASKAIEAVDRIDKYIDEHLANAHDMKDSNPDKKYYRGWDDALGKMSGILQDVYSGEKQKEQKPNIEICPHSIKSKSYKENGYPIEDCDYGLEIAFDILEKTFGEVQGYQTDDGIREHQTAIEAVRKAKEQKPAEWSEEDETYWNLIWDILDGPFSTTKDGYKKASNWFIKNCPKGLKSLRPSWKPSEEQMKALEECGECKRCIKELCEQLKNL